MLTTVGPASSSPKIALKGIAQRTFSRALTNKKSSPKGNEKEKEKQQREKDKEKSKDLAKRASVTERLDLKEEPKEDPSGAALPEMPKKVLQDCQLHPQRGEAQQCQEGAHGPFPQWNTKTRNEEHAREIPKCPSAFQGRGAEPEWEAEFRAPPAEAPAGRQTLQFLFQPGVLRRKRPRRDHPEPQHQQPDCQWVHRDHPDHRKQYRQCSATSAPAAIQPSQHCHGCTFPVQVSDGH